MPALLIDLQANWREWLTLLGLGLLLGTMGGFAILALAGLGLLT